ncbi:MAG: RNA polymerase sigma factor [Lachnospiraceae bacterium]|nr:RNA polymerase sigma factor [Lachnospiraceae bacterium]
MDFEQIYKSYFRDVFLYLCSLSANEDIAEEMAQETFAKALKSIDTFDGAKDIRAWLFTIAKNTYYTFCKKQKIYANGEISENVADVQIDLAERFADEENAFRIHQFLHDMNEPYKEVFSLRVFGELPFERIGRIFGKSPGWARVTFYRAKKQILEYMEAMEDEKN